LQRDEARRRIVIALVDDQCFHPSLLLSEWFLAVHRMIRMENSATATTLTEIVSLNALHLTWI
jgi:hypothetical protein